MRRREETVAAGETIALVLGDHSPLPETAADVEVLTLRLRGHINRLGAVLPPTTPALAHAQQLGSAPVPCGYVRSRVHLVRLAEATQDLVSTAQDLTERSLPWWRRSMRQRWRPRRHAGRVAVFAVALLLLAIAASVPRE
nr:DUF6415 family natural product biosynthesis protein [Streptomyces sp. Tu 3180]